MKAVRVAMVIQRYSPIIGGAENQCRQLIRALRRQGTVEVPFVLTQRMREDLSRRDRIDGVEVVRIGLPGIGRWSAYYFLMVSMLYLILRFWKFDVIHGHSASLYGFFLGFCGRLTGRPVVLKMSSNGEFYKGLGHDIPPSNPVAWLLRKLRRPVMRLAAQWAFYVGLNQEGLAELREGGATRLALIPNGVDLSLFRPATVHTKHGLRAAYGLQNHDVVLLFCGRFVFSKGLDLMVAAFREIVRGRGRDHVKLCLIGSSDLQRESMQAEVDALVREFPDNVLLLPAKDPVVEYLQIADLFVFPSRREGMPNAVLEALAVGLPCVLSRIGPHEELLASNPQAQIYLFDLGVPRHLAATLGRAIEDTCNEAGKAARSRLAHEYDIRHVGRRYLDVYRSLLRRDKAQLGSALDP